MNRVRVLGLAALSLVAAVAVLGLSARAGPTSDLVCPAAEETEVGPDEDACRAARDVDRHASPVVDAVEDRSVEQVVDGARTTLGKVEDDLDDWLGECEGACTANASATDDAACPDSATVVWYPRTWNTYTTIGACAAVSPTGNASCHDPNTSWRNYDYDYCVAASGTGDARCRASYEDDDGGGHCIAVSGTGDASCGYTEWHEGGYCHGVSIGGDADCWWEDDSSDYGLATYEDNPRCTALSTGPTYDWSREFVAVGEDSTEGGMVTASLFGSARCDTDGGLSWPDLDVCVAASLEGSASCDWSAETCVAVSGDPDRPGSCQGRWVHACVGYDEAATCPENEGGLPSCGSASVFGDAGGGAAVSGTGDAQGTVVAASLYGDASCEGQPLLFFGYRACVAVSGTGTASCNGLFCSATSGTGGSNGDGVIVTGLGRADGGVVAVSGTGQASTQQCDGEMVATWWTIGDWPVCTWWGSLASG